MKKKNFKVKCATCKEEFAYYDSEYRPFCSERCKMVDLGLWLNESYTVAGAPVPTNETDSEEGD